MRLTGGMRLGPYEILGPIGAGGMGEVYRARDPRLARDVALKVVRDGGLAGESLHRRFETEARAVAQLSHPNILAIYDVGTDGDIAYVVTELLEGESLRTRLDRGPLTPRRAAELGAAVADGLAAAHAKGIVHRDLKPDNLFLPTDGRVKILDFGLALLNQPPQSGSADEDPTVTRNTDPGTVLGTVSYMSPEQVRGEVVDARSDVFSFGIVLYEMVAGRRPFVRGTPAETQTAILNDDAPDLDEAMPADLSRVVAHCLEKAREHRFQSARDLAFALGPVASGSQTTGTRAPAPGPRRWGWSAAALLGFVGAFALGWSSRHPDPVAAPPSVVALSPGLEREFAPAISPDGKFVVYLADSGSEASLWVKFIGGGPPANITPDRTGLILRSETIIGGPDVSPDGTEIVFRANTPEQSIQTASSWVIPAPLGGPARKLVDPGGGARWSPDGRRIAFVLSGPIEGDAIAVARADGGQEQILVPRTPGLHTHQLAWSPDGAYIYFVRTFNSNNGAPAEIWRVPAQGGKAEPVVRTAGLALNPTPTPDGKALIYAGDRGAEGQNLWWRPLDGGAERRLTTGSGEYTEPRLSRDGRRLVCGARSLTESLAVVKVNEENQRDPSQPLTGPRTGDGEPFVGASGQTVFSSTRNGARNVWGLDASGKPRQITSGPQVDRLPALSPDGTRVAFVSDRDGGRGLWVVSADGGSPVRLVAADVLDRPSWSPDGSEIVYAARSGGAPGLWLVPAKGGDPTAIPGVPGRAPAWSPVADTIVYLAQDKDSARVGFTDHAGRVVRPDIHEEHALHSLIAWSHDGKRIALTSNPTAAEADISVIDLQGTPALKRIAVFSPRFKLMGLSWAADDRSIVFGHVQYASRILLLDGLP